MFRSLRFLLLAPLPLMLAACISAGPAAADVSMGSPAALGVDLGGSGPVSGPAAANPATPAPAPSALFTNGRAAQRGGEMQMAHGGQNDGHGTGTINTVDAAAHKINVSHGPITELGWPAMTMEFPVAPSVDLRALKPGMKIDFTIEQGQGGPVIQSVTPAAGGR